jgi:phage head maturation protease
VCLHVDVTIPYMRMATVTRKSIPITIAVFFSFLWSINMVAFPSYAETSCAVMKSIMPVTANHRLTFQKSRGICIGLFLQDVV